VATVCARLKARQGCHHFVVQDADVKDPDTMEIGESVPRDGRMIAMF
jgi:hypothetical protein